ncbi:MAG: DUF350 domain-containing protein [Gemmatimonadaceae bacterium]
MAASRALLRLAPLVGSVSHPELSTGHVPRGFSVEFSVIALNILYAVIGVVLMWVSYRVIDRMTPEVDFPVELQKGNIAVAIFIASLFVSIAIIIGKALG